MAYGPVSVPCRGSKKSMRAIYLLRAASPRPGRARLRMLPAPDAVPPITCGDPDRLDDGSRRTRGRPPDGGRAARPGPVRGRDARPDPRAGGPALRRLSQLRRRHPGEPARLDDRAPPRGPLPVLRHPLPQRDLPRRRYPAGHEPPGRGAGVSLLGRRRRLPPLLPRPGLVRGPRVLRPPGPGPGAPPHRHRRPPPRPPRRPHPVALRRGLPGLLRPLRLPLPAEDHLRGGPNLPLAGGRLPRRQVGLVGLHGHPREPAAGVRAGAAERRPRRGGAAADRGRPVPRQRRLRALLPAGPWATWTPPCCGG